MVFNWFRRKFDEDKTPKEGAIKSASTPTEEFASETAGEVETQDADRQDKDEPELDDASPATPPSRDVYLEWAKAAFQNIQQRQTNQASEIEAADLAADLPIDSPADDTESATIAVDSPTKEAIETVIAEVEPSSGDTRGAAIDSIEVTAAVELEVELEVEEEITAKIEIADVIPDVIPEIKTETKTEIIPEPTAPSATPTPITPTPINPPPEPEKPSTPAWMRAAAEREARLERLQETAIATSDAFEQLPDRGGVSGEIELDEDFIWSAEVLAAQGRSADDISLEEIAWLKKLRDGLGKTRIGLVNQLKSIVGQGPLNEDAVTEIEALLLQADVGVDATDAIVEALQAKMREETLPPEEAIAYLKQVLRDMLEQPFERNYDRDFSPVPDMLNIWMMTGVNGAGKTTTIGKLTHLAKSSGYDCLIAAADTFRAAAVEQVKVWGERTQTDVIANPGQNTDPASVVFDAIEAAKARNVNLLLIDTAGRLQNKKNLMDELSKMRRIINTKAPKARIESLLVLDATLGQNGLRQAEVFAEAAQLSGVVLTKLDGSARGGVALAVVRQLGLPIRFIGAGEGIEDLRPFSSYEFVEALLDG